MPTVLITGANRGLGLEYARQYADDGWRVIATCRVPETAMELTRIRGEVEIRALDIGNQEQIHALWTQLLYCGTVQELMQRSTAAVRTRGLSCPRRDGALGSIVV